MSAANAAGWHCRRGPSSPTDRPDAPGAGHHLAHPPRRPQDRDHPRAGDAGGDARRRWWSAASTSSPSGCCAASGFAGALGRKRLWNRLPPLRGPMVRRMLARAPRPAARRARERWSSPRRSCSAARSTSSPSRSTPRSSAWCTLLATLGGRAEVTLFLSIRSFDTQLPSAYVQELKVHAADRRRLRGHPAPGAGAAAELVRAGARGSAPRRRGCRSGSGGRRTTAANAAAILAGLCGRRPARAAARDRRSGLDPLARSSRRSGAAEALPPRLPSHERRARVRAIFRADGAASGPPFQPFSRRRGGPAAGGLCRRHERIAALDPEHADAVLRPLQTG